ncbi:hypothetical protein BDA96_09G016400 [Sorghum bicolor]|uniref:Inositol polyphosphate-related phosphatase domain-containing protein n=1 Tax=Sorghum bicolor TaxID=4558 RepID=A0A921QAE5_SORBI|nr:hypothetical protein BDA96_09G016400 [Sorghum bicolor]
MRTTRNHPTMSKSSSWPKAKTVVKKWLNLKDSEFHSDCIIDESFGGATMRRRRKSCSDREDLSGGWLVEESSPDNLRLPPLPRPRYGSPAAPSSTWRPPKELRMFVGTWNVGGRAPHGGLDLSDWLTDDGPHSSSPHIYVLGFQEIVPLNAGNVLGAEDKAPARKWLDLIRRALNGPASDAATSSSSSSSSSRSHRSPSDIHLLQKASRVSFSDLLAAAEDDDNRSRPSTASSEPDDDEEDDAGSEPSTSSSTPESSSEEEPAARRRHRGGRYRYRLAASKQMVGILLCVWVRADLLPYVAGVRASCVGRGVMGYMGNKGSVSVSLTLRGGASSLCFVCTHLASGDRDGDGARRNGDVAEILRRTRFAPRERETTILEHDKVIWLGDLNYRLLLEREDDVTRELVERHEWAALLERDQLRAEQKAGRVFAGWEEGRIAFPPTYKYVAGSDAYAMMSVADSSASTGAAADGSRSRERKKKRTPAWCDRILWRGEGIEQQWYARGESRFSDHRPVAALFSTRVGSDKPAPAHSSRF